ncbi:MAG: hypothetical protein GY778_22950 [bacterium]|nr:hypothetical protein [bacterium]
MDCKHHAKMTPAEQRVVYDRATEARLKTLRERRRKFAGVSAFAMGDELWHCQYASVPYTQFVFRFPVLLVSAVLGAYPAITLVRGRLRRWCRLRKGCCLTCAYDLTGNVSGKCPECGVEIGGIDRSVPDAHKGVDSNASDGR